VQVLEAKNLILRTIGISQSREKIGLRNLANNIDKDGYASTGAKIIRAMGMAQGGYSQPLKLRYIIVRFFQPNERDVKNNTLKKVSKGN